MKPRYSFSSRRTRKIENIRKQKGKYPELTKKILEDSDIILEVVDARFLKETKNKEILAIAKRMGKEVLYVGNKCDLIENKTIKKNSKIIFVSCKSKKGIKELREEIKKRAKKLKKEKIIVGIIGYPNTGKSSLINVLIGKNSAKTAPTAGFTKGLQKIKLSQGVVLVDSPGVIPKEEYSPIDIKKIAQHTKVGGRSYSQIREPEIVLSELTKEFPKTFNRFYGLEENIDSEELIEKIGKKRGFLKKGGEVNEDKTARMILKDWQEGKIKAEY